MIVAALVLLDLLMLLLQLLENGVLPLLPVELVLANGLLRLQSGEGAVTRNALLMVHHTDCLAEDL